MTIARFVFWLISLALIGTGAWLIHPALAFIAVGGIVLFQVIIGEVYALYHSPVTVPKRK